MIHIYRTDRYTRNPSPPPPPPSNIRVSRVHCIRGERGWPFPGEGTNKGNTAPLVCEREGWNQILLGGLFDMYCFYYMMTFTLPAVGARRERVCRCVGCLAEHPLRGGRKGGGVEVVRSSFKSIQLDCLL